MQYFCGSENIYTFSYPFCALHPHFCCYSFIYPTDLREIEFHPQLLSFIHVKELVCHHLRIILSHSHQFSPWVFKVKGDQKKRCGSFLLVWSEGISLENMNSSVPLYPSTSKRVRSCWSTAPRSCSSQCSVRSCKHPSVILGFTTAQPTGKRILQSHQEKQTNKQNVGVTLRTLKLNDFYLQFNPCASLWKQSILGWDLFIK